MAGGRGIEGNSTRLLSVVIVAFGGPVDILVARVPILYSTDIVKVYFS